MSGTTTIKEMIARVDRVIKRNPPCRAAGGPDKAPYDAGAAAAENLPWHD